MGHAIRKMKKQRCPVTGKWRYAGHTEAEWVAARVAEANADGKLIDAYHCQHCIGWHVGHRWPHRRKFPVAT